MSSLTRENPDAEFHQLFAEVIRLDELALRATETLRAYRAHHALPRNGTAYEANRLGAIAIRTRLLERQVAEADHKLARAEHALNSFFDAHEDAYPYLNHQPAPNPVHAAASALAADVAGERTPRATPRARAAVRTPPTVGREYERLLVEAREAAGRAGLHHLTDAEAISWLRSSTHPRGEAHSYSTQFQECMAGLQREGWIVKDFPRIMAKPVKEGWPGADTGAYDTIVRVWYIPSRYNAPILFCDEVGQERGKNIWVFSRTPDKSVAQQMDEIATMYCAPISFRAAYTTPTDPPLGPFLGALRRFKPDAHFPPDATVRAFTGYFTQRDHRGLDDCAKVRDVINAWMQMTLPRRAQLTADKFDERVAAKSRRLANKAGGGAVGREDGEAEEEEEDELAASGAEEMDEGTEEEDEEEDEEEEEEDEEDEEDEEVSYPLERRDGDEYRPGDESGDEDEDEEEDDDSLSLSVGALRLAPV
jgi:hypothetical protein